MEQEEIIIELFYGAVLVILVMVDDNCDTCSFMCLSIVMMFVSLQLGLLRIYYSVIILVIIGAFVTSIELELKFQY
jgi:hypothetical protein